MLELNLDDFSKQIEDFTKNVEAAIDKSLQEIVIEIGSSVVMLSPVLTGRFRGNWQLTLGTPSNFSLNTYDPIGSATIAEIVQKAQFFTAGQVAYIVNNLTYGPLIETGDHSRKAPNGVVRVTAARFLEIVEDAVRKNQV